MTIAKIVWVSWKAQDEYHELLLRAQHISPCKHKATLGTLPPAPWDNELDHRPLKPARKRADDLLCNQLPYPRRHLVCSATWYVYPLDASKMT